MPEFIKILYIRAFTPVSAMVKTKYIEIGGYKNLQRGHRALMESSRLASLRNKGKLRLTDFRCCTNK